MLLKREGGKYRVRLNSYRYTSIKQITLLGKTNARNKNIFKYIFVTIMYYINNNILTLALPTALICN